MIETTEETDEREDSLLGQVKEVFRDGLDYLGSVVSLVQARAAGLALSSVVFLGMILFGGLVAVAAFVLLSVAFGLWLSQALGSAAQALLIIGVLYAALATIMTRIALRWLSRLKS